MATTNTVGGNTYNIGIGIRGRVKNIRKKIKNLEMEFLKPLPSKLYNCLD